MLRSTCRAALVLGLVSLVGACATAPVGEDVARNAGTDVLVFDGLSLMQQEQKVQRQATALTARTQDILRKSTLRGAGLGAAAGCGLGVVSGNAQRCLQGAVVGGAVGGLAGHAAGKKQVAKRIEIVALSPLVSSLSKAGARVAEIETGLPALLAAQDAELTQMQAAVQSGALSQDAYAKRLAEIAQSRRALAASLDLSAQQSSSARAALKDAQSQGQTGMDWHLFETQRIENAALSSRASITLI